MNATKLYAQLSRKVMLLNNGVFLGEFISNDMTLLKLRSLLLCRSCKEICKEPFSSEFCQHLTCEICLREKKLRLACCKWCRNPEDLSADFQSKILIASYRKLCAILRDFVTGYINNTPGINLDLKGKLLQTLDEGCVSPRIPWKKTEIIKAESTKPETELKSTETVSKATQADIFPPINEETPVCPPCCCRCPNVNGGPAGLENPQIVDKAVEIRSDEVVLVPTEKKCDYNSDYRSDTVSSTVPDTLPVIIKSLPVENAENKHGIFHKDGSDRDSTNEIESQVKSEPNLKIESDNNLEAVVREPPVTSCQFYDALTTISMKERQNRSIFEKFGLALSPTNKIENEPPPRTKKIEKHRIKLKKTKEKKLTYTCEIKPKLQPLKLKVRKVNSYDNDGFSVQYNISNSNENSEIENFTIRKTTDTKTSEDCTSYSDVTGSDSQEPEERKVKRKATFINNYMSAFSDDSDFESDSAISKRQLKSSGKKDRSETCSCGSGSHVKYFTNICKRSRCPCFSQGRSCATCKCRCCSNPYSSENKVDDMFTDSESENDQPPPLTYEQPPLTYWLKEETDVVDVESV